MEKVIVRKEDLKGKIADFPLEVVQKMVDCQIEQGNKGNPEIFSSFIDASRPSGGFSWAITEEGHIFWDHVINGKNFKKFFEHFPKKSLDTAGEITLKKQGKITLNFSI